MLVTPAPPTALPNATNPVWGVFYARWVVLLGGAVALVAFRSRLGNFPIDGVIVAALVGALVNLALVPVGAVKQAATLVPITLTLGDALIVLLFTQSAQGSPLVAMVSAGGLMFVGLLSNAGGWAWLHAPIVAAAGIASMGMTPRLPAEAESQWMASATLTLLGVAAAGVSYAQDKNTGELRRLVGRLTSDQQRVALDIRERANALSELTFILSSTLNYKTVLDATLEAGRLGLRLPESEASNLIGAVFLYHVDDSKLHVVSARRFTRADEARALEGKQGVVGRALREAIPVIGTEAHDDPELQFFVAFQYCKSLLCIPLRAGFDSFGVLVFGSESEHAFSADQSEVLRAIGLQSTIALQNAVLYSNLLTEKERIIDADEDARKKLSRDLHDGPTQGVAGIAMRLAYIQKLITKKPEEVADELRKAEDLARKTTKEMRHMLFTLRPLVLETQGLSAALNQLADKMYEMHRQAVAVRIEGDVEDYLDQHQQGVLFYIVEEAVNNARKHAKAKLISVTTRRQEDVAIVQIVDNGVGFSVEKVQAGYDTRSSLGMVNMRERADMLDATLSIDSVSGRGTVITAIVPLKALDPGQKNDVQRSATKLARAAASRVERGALENHLKRQNFTY